GRHDGRPFEHRLEEEAQRTLGRSQGVEPLRVRGARRAVVTKKFDVAAKRDRGDFPARAVPVVEADKFGAETYGKDEDPHTAQPGDQEMAKLMEEDHQAEDEQKRNEIGDNASAQRM